MSDVVPVMRSAFVSLIVLITLSCGESQAWQELSGGLKYRDLKTGAGRSPEKGDYVGVLYTGWIEESGEEFDRLDDAKRPFRFAFGEGQVIEGWDQGLAGIQSGGERELLIPPELAYGEAGSGPIPPNATLRFRIKLIQVQPAPKPWPVKDEQVHETPSGLKYIVYDEGQGERPEPGDMVVFHSSGFFADGTLFDSSKIRATPVHFLVGSGDVIPGWDEGLQLMRPYARYKLMIPPHLAYGKNGAGPIPGDATLHFDVQLLRVTNPDAPEFQQKPSAP